MTDDPVDQKPGLSLADVAAQRTVEESTRDGKSGDVLYHLEYQKDEPEVVNGKSTEVGRIADTDRMDLKPLKGQGYEHYAIFRLQDRSTVTLVQNSDGEVFKTLTLGANTAKISCPVRITRTTN